MDLPSGTKREPNGQSAPSTQVSSTLRPGARFSSNREIAVVQADYLALANDLEQAQSLASTLELQLSGKTNELARFKLIWEQTQTDLVKLAQDLDTMRSERHSLANEVQRAYAIEHKFEKLKAAHEELTTSAARLESELIRERAAHARSRTELEELQAKSCPKPEDPPRGKACDPNLQRALEVLRDQLDRVLGARPGKANSESRLKTAALDRIDIEFGG